MLSNLKTIQKNVYHNNRLAREFGLKMLTALIPPNTNAAQFKDMYSSGIKSPIELYIADIMIISHF
uniref:Uncharacterized protein n=1 Tax=Romanomermis culicivorax TaxID=13658 RepID=A0A915JQN7_ROMCU